MHENIQINLAKHCTEVVVTELLFYIVLDDILINNILLTESVGTYCYVAHMNIRPVYSIFARLIRAGKCTNDDDLTKTFGKVPGVNTKNSFEAASHDCNKY